MKLSDLVGMRIDKVPREALPGLLGEVEVIKARLWSRLMQIEQQDRELGIKEIGFEIRKQLNALMPKIKAPEPITKADPTVTGESRIIRFKEVCKIVGLSRTTIWNMVNEGRFPRQRKIGKMAVGWLDKEIYEWMGKDGRDAL